MENLIEEINKKRLESKGKWYYFSTEINGKKIEIKAFKTWLQILRIDGKNYSGLMDISVKDFKNHLLRVLNKELTQNIVS